MSLDTSPQLISPANNVYRYTSILHNASPVIACGTDIIQSSKSIPPPHIVLSRNTQQVLAPHIVASRNTQHATRNTLRLPQPRQRLLRVIDPDAIAGLRQGA